MLLDVLDVSAGYGRFPIIHGINLRLNPGDSLAIIGPNGSGKSTLAKTIMGLTNMMNGRIVFKGLEVNRHPPDARVHMGIGFLPQTQNTFPDLTVRENIEMGGFGLPRSALRRRIEEILSLFPELRPRLKQVARTLSGGERQMLALARALVRRPDLLILDEPSAGLAPRVVERIYGVIDRLKKEGLTLIVVEQHARKALEACDRGVVMVGGRIAMEGSSRELLATDLRAVFFQRA